MNSKTDMQIGRFQVVDKLGEGGQGTVYLADDPHLGRQVAIKVLASDSEIGALLDEARIVSKLQHPNIVTLFDAGEYEGKPYLVFEYVKGKTLGKLIKEEGALAPQRAANIALQVVEGIRCAHEQNIVHRDLKPANIMIDSTGVPRVMDFGIATSLQGEPLDSPLVGSPLYLAPECIKGLDSGLQSDIFSIGMILYEMLIGRHPVSGSSVDEVLRKISTEPLGPPSRFNQAIDEKLDSIVLKALAIDPANRYQDATGFIVALKGYLEPDTEAASEEGKKSTLEFLLRRIRLKGDFPAISQAISAINRIANSDEENVTALSNVVLKDFSLTNKLLKLVNAAVYSQFGGTITTISRAVVILGFQTVRNVAISLMLFEHLQNKSQAQKLKDQVIATFYSGVLARELAGKVGVWNHEEAFVCSMFHNLGRLLATFYFHEEMLEVERVMQQRKIDEKAASSAVLGISFEELGIGIAHSWNFPEKIVASMRSVDDAKVRKPDSEIAKLRVLSSLTSELCGIAGEVDPELKGKALALLVKRFEGAVPVSGPMLTRAIEESMKKFQADARILEINTKNSDFLREAKKWPGRPEIQVETQVIESEQELEEELQATMKIDIARDTKEKPDAQEILGAGIQEITNTLCEEYALNDLLRMVLETMYRGMDFSRALLCVKDAKQNLMLARFGFGVDIETIKQRFKFPLAKSATNDVFQFTMEKGLDIFIEDVDAENIRDRIPTWYRSGICAKSFILFPIVVDKKPIGLLYGDQLELGELKIEQKHLTLLKTLRNQAVLAIKQKL